MSNNNDIPEIYLKDYLELPNSNSKDRGMGKYELFKVPIDDFVTSEKNLKSGDFVPILKEEVSYKQGDSIPEIHFTVEVFKIK